MIFKSNGNQIECYRVVSQNDGSLPKEIKVVSFDEQQDKIPPHVAAGLNEIELNKLRGWLKDRKRLNTKLEKETLEETILDTMPELLKMSREALAEVKVIELGLFRSLKNQLRELDEQLNSFQSITKQKNVELKKMQDDEILKEKLKTIKRSL